MATIHKLELVDVGQDYRDDPDRILDAAKGQDLTIVTIIGEQADGTLWVSGSANAGVCMILMERAKRQIVFGE